jgi:hypothetical protein
MKVLDSAEIFADDVSEISWEELTDDVHIPSAHVVGEGCSACSCDLRCDTDCLSCG